MNQKKNITLIGMPGCGKSTVGKMLSKNLSMKLVDVDEYIEEMENTSIREIFDEGEEHFRDIESKYIVEVSKLEGTIICTGGGVVKRKINMISLKENSVIIFINRPIENIIKDIDTDSRPLLRAGKERIYKLFEERYELYKNYCHIEVSNDRSLEELVDEISQRLE